MTATTREAAIAAGLNKYTAGTCAKCGRNVWYVKTGQCVYCICKRTCDWVKANPEQHAVNSQKYRDANPERVKAYGLKSSRKAQGIPEPIRDAPEHCECCARKDQLRPDHDHETGKFRGWLCNQCNTGLGLLGDDAVGIMLMGQYLARTYE